MNTIPALTLRRLRGKPDEVAFYTLQSQVWSGYGPPGAPPPAPEGWVGYTGRACELQLSGLVKRLVSLGVERGVVVAILADTSHAWAATDLATLCAGGVVVGIYPSLTAEDAAWQLQNCEARVLVVQGAAQYEKMKAVLEGLPHLKHVLSFEPNAGCPQLVPDEADLSLLDARANAVQADDPATYIYTSGTTGNPKGAILTHRVVTDTVRIANIAVPITYGDRGVIFLPMAHILQRYALYQGLDVGLIGYYCPSIAELRSVLLVARPMVFATVPRFLEKVKAGAEAVAAEKGERAVKLMNWAVEVGQAHAHAKREGYIPLGLRLQYAIADRILLSKIRGRLGGSVRLIASGGAALNPTVNAWFEGVGICVREVWGLTETCGPATLVRENEWRPGTVGRPMDEVEIKLDTDGEVLVRGPNLFKGYFKDPDATAAVMTEDGFFRTGDIGRIDAEGFLKIVDRKKELIVTAGGKNIPPVNIEKKIEGGLLGQVVVIGSERPYLVALIAADPEVLQATANEKGWTGDYETLSKRPEIRAAFQERVSAVNAGQASFESIKRFAILPAPLTPETGELTPTLKLKRRIIVEKYRGLIEEMYAGGGGGD